MVTILTMQHTPKNHVREGFVDATAQCAVPQLRHQPPNNNVPDSGLLDVRASWPSHTLRFKQAVEQWQHRLFGALCGDM
jgi:hypothetical protein